LFRQWPGSIFLHAISGKELHMEWDQIEDKWTAMTRRIRADWKDPPKSLRGTESARGAATPVSAPPSDRSTPDTGAGDNNLSTHP